MGGTSCSDKEEMKKGPWTREEDQKLLAYIQEHGHGSWRNLPAKAGLQRCGKSCRLRWTNYLRPDIKRGKFSPPEEKAIIRLHALLGNRWSAIATHLPQRTDNEIKNYWNTRLKKRLTRMGIDPATHKPKNNPPGSAQSRHMVQWEAARLEAEARLARDSKLLSSIHLLHNARPPPPPLPPCLDVLTAWQATAPNPSRFFASPGTLESPTSTLDFSSCSLTVQTVSTVMANDVASMTSCGVALAQADRFGTEIKGKTVNSLHDDIFYHDMGNGFETVGPMDLAAFDQEPLCCGMFDPVVGELGDGGNDWNDLLDLVCSTMETHPL